jgi:hypothetical protein
MGCQDWLWAYADPSPALAPFPVPGRSSLLTLLRRACTDGGSCVTVGGRHLEDSYAMCRGRTPDDARGLCAGFRPHR